MKEVTGNYEVAVFNLIMALREQGEYVLLGKWDTERGTDYPIVCRRHLTDEGRVKVGENVWQ